MANSNLSKKQKVTLSFVIILSAIFVVCISIAVAKINSDNSSSTLSCNVVEGDATKLKHAETNYSESEPIEDYNIRLMPGEKIHKKDAVSLSKTTIAKNALLPPESATYTLKNDTDGYATGKITINVDSSLVNNSNIVMYWADENGTLPDYTSLAKCPIKNKKVTYRIPNSVLIPNKATRLLVYTEKNDALSDEFVSIDLPKGAALQDLGKPLFTYTVCSDVHIELTEGSPTNAHFKNMLEDVASFDDNNNGIFIVGDIANSGDEREYRKAKQIWDEVKSTNPNLPQYYMSLGNHDLGVGEKNDQFDYLCKLFTQYATLPDGSHPTSTFYDFWLGGYHFVFVGNDKLEAGSWVTLGDESLKWLDETIGENYDPQRPTFIFLHQALKNTVAGSLEGQHWDGIAPGSEAGWRKVLSKYPEAIMFNGHSHWIMDSESNMYINDPYLPKIFNTASVGYEWQTYGDPHWGGEKAPGSEGYTMEIYPDKVIIRGREYEQHKWKPSAYYCVDYSKSNAIEYNIRYMLNGGRNSPSNPYTFKDGTEVILKDPVKAGYIFDGWYSDMLFSERITKASGKHDVVVYAKWVKEGDDSSEQQNSSSTTDVPSVEKHSGCSSSITALPVIGLTGIALSYTIIKKRRNK